MQVILPAVKRIRTGDSRYIQFEIKSNEQRNMLYYFFHQREVEKKNPYYTVVIKTPRRPRTTGWKSQNHHINGHLQQIAMQTGNSFSAVKERMKELAIDRGYPVETLPDGSVKPISESEIDTTQAGYLIDTIHQFAAEWGINLIEED